MVKLIFLSRMSNLSQSEIREFINSYTTTDRSKFFFMQKRERTLGANLLRLNLSEGGCILNHYNGS